MLGQYVETMNPREMRSGPVAFETSSFIDPPLFNIAVRFFWENCGLVGQSAEVTPSVHVGKLNLVVPFPVEITRVQVVGTIEQQQVIGQLFGRCEMSHVDERMRRGELVVIDATQNDGHRVVNQSLKQFLSDVIGAERILKGQIEFVIGSEHLEAKGFVLLTAREITASAVNVDGDQLTQLVDVFFTLTRRRTMRYEPGDQFIFPLCYTIYFVMCWFIIWNSTDLPVAMDNVRV